VTGRNLPKRADLGDTDQALWETDKNGKPIDPWSQQTYVPMIQVETGELYCFIFRSFGGKQTFRDLCRAYSPYRTNQHAAGDQRSNRPLQA